MTYKDFQNLISVKVPSSWLFFNKIIWPQKYRSEIGEIKAAVVLFLSFTWMKCFQCINFLGTAFDHCVKWVKIWIPFFDFCQSGCYVFYCFSLNKESCYDFVIYIGFYDKKKQRQRVACRLVSCIKETLLIPISLQQSSHMIALINKHEAFHW